eukprot:TRINITY_DN883_c2_g1_i2.p1 TRINITY_DN883_c2_g1~~TRINITY_DN883_c2_g1_i2.p1  ORF type:complete len:240 (-),score=41.88 TRINITY_DN883_c2_g1_i2:93-812(-)
MRVPFGHREEGRVVRELHLLKSGEPVDIPRTVLPTSVSDVLNTYQVEFFPSRNGKSFENLYARKKRSSSYDSYVQSLLRDTTQFPEQPVNVIQQFAQNTDRSATIAKNESRWNKFVKGIIPRPEEQQKIYAVIKGINFDFYMTTTEVTIGRATPDNEVDLDLAKYGDAKKVSRIAALVEYDEDNMSFSLTNVGRKAIKIGATKLLHPSNQLRIKKKEHFEIGPFIMTLVPSKGMCKGRK